MRLSTVAILCILCVLMAAPAYAYVDPGTGGMLVQLVTGGVAGGLVLLRLYWGRLKTLFTRTPPAGEPSETSVDGSKQPK